ncbi:hypothetical protein [Halobellus limi]|uniref:Uncharacterized protein n=1 Tax=Halobellus limi TaxID=699433 RepID=A0A1H5W5W3_9EURY|nr:hypothetical protein [Halobellus limi]SEF94728.1 hypothetical protein SAMN04488133_1172 [Halobellus limi]
MRFASAESGDVTTTAAVGDATVPGVGDPMAAESRRAIAEEKTPGRESRE